MLLLHIAIQLVVTDGGISPHTPYIKAMNRRRFIQSLVSVFYLPAVGKLSMGAATAALPTAAAVPANARFWAIYMSALHGECTPQTMQNLLHIPAVDAKKYVGQLVAEGVIKPNPLLQRSVSKVLSNKDDSLLSKFKKRLEMKEKGKSNELDVSKTIDTRERLDGDEVSPEVSREIEPETLVSDDCLENEIVPEADCKESQLEEIDKINRNS